MQSNESYVLCAVCKNPYSFDDKETKEHKEGFSYRVALLRFVNDERFPRSCEIAKIAGDYAESKEVLSLVGKKVKAFPLYDRFGRFCGFSPVFADDSGN